MALTGSATTGPAPPGRAGTLGASCFPRARLGPALSGLPADGRCLRPDPAAPAFVKAAGGSALDAGLIYWAGAIGAAVLLFGGRLTERIGAGWAAAIGAGLYAAAMVIIWGGGPGWSVDAAGVLLGAGWALVFTAAPIIASSMPGRAPADQTAIMA